MSCAQFHTGSLVLKRGAQTARVPASFPVWSMTIIVQYGEIDERLSCSSRGRRVAHSKCTITDSGPASRSESEWTPSEITDRKEDTLSACAASELPTFEAMAAMSDGVRVGKSRNTSHPRHKFAFGCECTGRKLREPLTATTGAPATAFVST